MKKAAKRLTKHQRHALSEIQKREAAFKEKAEALQKEEQELVALRKKNILENCNAFTFQKPELDAFVSALAGNSHVNDIAVALMNAAQANKVDMQQFQVKLVRLGIIV